MMMMVLILYATTEDYDIVLDYWRVEEKRRGFPITIILVLMI